MKTVWYAFISECMVLSHCQGAISMFVIGILFYSWLYPVPYFKEVPQKQQVVVIDQDNSTTSRLLLRHIGATEGVKLKHADNIARAMEDLRAGRVSGMLIMPSGMERDVLLGKDVTVPLFCDAAHLLSYRLVLQGVRQATEIISAGIRSVKLEKAGMPNDAALQLMHRGRPDIRLLYNASGNYGLNTVPPVLILIMQQILIVGCSMLEVRRRSLFFLHKELSQDQYSSLGRLMVPSAVSMLIATYYLRLLPSLDDLVFIPHFLDALLFLFPFFLACSSLGYLMGCFFRKEETILQYILPCSLPMLFMSGFVWPSESMPDFFSGSRGDNPFNVSH